MRSLLLFIVLGFTGILQAQVVINEDPDISQAMNAYRNIALENTTIDGWRIQIINTDDRRQMESARSKFSVSYPHLKMTWEHVQPYYQVKVGAYRNKMHLESFLREIKSEFPRHIPVRDKKNK